MPSSKIKLVDAMKTIQHIIDDMDKSSTKRCIQANWDQLLRFMASPQRFFKQRDSEPNLFTGEQAYIYLRPTRALVDSLGNVRGHSFMAGEGYLRDRPNDYPKYDWAIRGLLKLIKSMIDSKINVITSAGEEFASWKKQNVLLRHHVANGFRPVVPVRKNKLVNAMINIQRIIDNTGPSNTQHCIQANWGRVLRFMASPNAFKIYTGYVGLFSDAPQYEVVSATTELINSFREVEGHGFMNTDVQLCDRPNDYNKYDTALQSLLRLLKTNIVTKGKSSEVIAARKEFSRWQQQIEIRQLHAETGFGGASVSDEEESDFEAVVPGCR